MIKIKIYGCYELTYKPHCMKIARYLYGDSYNEEDFEIEVEDISDNGTRNIQSQRSRNEYVTRTVKFYENDVLTHIVGMSNTNYDKDRKNEFDNGNSNKSVDKYGGNDYHANTYIMQGINKIINYYFQNKDTSDLSFYLLDTNKGRDYPNNNFNVFTYRELTTIGFKILNISEIDFTSYNNVCNSNINERSMKYPSFDKFIRDIAYISQKNNANNPSIMQIDEVVREDEDGEYYTAEKYKYIFKSLSAQQYDSVIRCWCLKKLADQENKTIEFILGRQYFGFNNEELLISETLTKPVQDMLDNANIALHHLTNDEFMAEIRSENDTYLRYKQRGIIRNQLLFRNNLRRKGIPLECAVCGNDNTTILDAAHIWEVNAIKDASASEINSFLRINNLLDLVDRNNEHYNELFFKKYSLVNSGENGVWLCKNHHRLFDSNYYCFDSDDGRILLHFNDPVTALNFQNEIEHDRLPSNVLTDATKAFIHQRQLTFNA